MYLWRKSASEKWWRVNEPRLRAIGENRLAVIERPNRKRLQVEIASRSRVELQNFARQFGGRVQKLRRDWLKRSLHQQTKPIKVGNKRLTIPAAAAFGTGEHATTAMCLRLLEKLIRTWGAQAHPPAKAGPARTFGVSPKSSSRKSWRSRGRDRQHARRVRSPDLVVDLGTGSGILALAAKCLGAKRAIGVDSDPIAIRTAKQNARLNKIRDVEFRLADVRHWKLAARSRPRQGSGAQVDVVTANLFSELLIAILPKLTRARWLIFSGILRAQERDVRRAATRNKIDVIEVRRRGKWVAMLASCR
jgi:ribosomal protein L11 methyltransferase